jgi:hypothetical protein
VVLEGATGRCRDAIEQLGQGCLEGLI